MNSIYDCRCSIHADVTYSETNTLRTEGDKWTQYSGN